MKKEKKDSPALYGLAALALAFILGGLGISGLKVENGWDIIPITETITERIVDDSVSWHTRAWEENDSEYEKSISQAIIYDMNKNQRFERTTIITKDLEKMKQKQHQMWKAVRCRIFGVIALFAALVCFGFFIPLVVIWLDDAKWLRKSDSDES